MRPLKHIEENFEQKGHRALLLALLAVIFANPFLQHYDKFQWLLVVFLILVLLAAVRTVADQARQYQIAVIMAMLAVIPQFGILIERSEWLDTLRYVAMLAFLLLVCAQLLGNIILRSRVVTTELILGAINIYLMVGLAFAFLFGLIEHLHPGSFTGTSELMPASGSVLPFVYFSFVTLTTLGYGDITPITSYGMTATYTEAIFGQLYLATLVARLVGLYIARHDVSGTKS